MAKYKIEFDRELCIGALACTAVAENFWPTSDDGKVDLTGATYNEQTKKWELIIDEKDYEINKDAAEVCPVDAIVVTKIEESAQESTTEETQQPVQNTEQENAIQNNNQSTNEQNQEKTTQEDNKTNNFQNSEQQTNDQKTINNQQ